jgi:hypothetical protein
MHLGADAAGAGAGGRVGRPQTQGRVCLGEVFGDGQRVPDRDTGTRPAGLKAPTSRLNVLSISRPLPKRRQRSVKGMPAARISTQGRIDHEE